MTRIGFAYNQKPDQAALRLEDDDEARPDEEPPSTSRDDQSRIVTARAEGLKGTSACEVSAPCACSSSRMVRGLAQRRTQNL